MSKVERQIYNTAEKDAKAFEERVDTDENLSNENREIIKKFQETLYAKDNKVKRVGKLTYQLINIVQMLKGKYLVTITEQDLVSLVGKINSNNKWSDATKSDYKRCIKQFFAWYKRNDERLFSQPDTIRAASNFYLYLEKDVRTSYKTKRIHEKEIITEKDLSELISCAKSIRNKAFIAVLHESGARIGEMLGLRIKDISEDYSKILVDGKTGERSIPIKIISPVLLQRWIHQHPFRNDPEAYVWIQEGSNEYVPLNYPGANKMLRETLKLANIKKRSNLHWFRHSRMTINAGFMTEPVLRIFAGWSASSDMPSKYVHSGENQLTHALNVHYGLDKDKTKPSSIKCFSCDTHNISEAYFCTKCGKPLNSNADRLKEEKQTEALDFFEKILSNKELKDKFQEYIQNKKEVKE